MYQDSASQRKKIKEMILGANKEKGAFERESERNRIKEMLSAYMADPANNPRSSNVRVQEPSKTKVKPELETGKQPEDDKTSDYMVNLKNILNRQKQGQDTRLMQEYLAQGKKELDNAYYEKRIQAEKTNITNQRSKYSDPVLAGNNIRSQAQATVYAQHKAEQERLNQLEKEYESYRYTNAPRLEKQFTEKLEKIAGQLSNPIDEGARAALEEFREQTQKEYDAFHNSDAAKTYRYDQRQKTYGEQLQDKALEQQVKKLYSVSTHEKTPDNVDGIEISAGDTQAEYNDIFKKLEEDGYNPEGLLDYYTRKQNAIKAEKQQQEDEKFAEEHPVLASAKSIGMAPFKAFGMLDTGISALNEAITGELHPVDTNAKDFLATRAQGTIREKVSENMEGWQRFLYQTGMSMGDFLVTLPLGKEGALAVMASGAAADTAADVSKRGGSATQALLSGVAAGAAEVVFEKISIDQLKLFAQKKPGKLLDYVTNTVKGFFTEGSEEAATDVANAITDQIINGDNSQLENTYQAYIKQGLNEQEAWSKTAAEFAKQVGMDFAGGALSGAVMSAGASGIGAARSRSNAKALYNDVLNGNEAEVIKQGLSMPEDSHAYKLAAGLQDTLDSGKDVSGVKVGKLYQENMNQTRRQAFADIAEELSSKAGRENLTQTIEKIADGEKLSSSEATTIKENPKALKLLSELTGETLHADSSVKQIRQTAQAYYANPAKNEHAREIKQLIETREQLEQEAQKNGTQLPVLTAVAKASVNNTPVRVMEIDSVQKGEVRVRLSDEKTVNLKQVAFFDTRVQQVYQQAAQFDTNGAKEYVSNYMENPYYTGGFDAFYRSGKIGLTFQQAIRKIDAYAGQLPTEVIKAAYDAGVQDYRAQADAQQAELIKARKKKGSVEVKTTKPMTEKVKSQTATLNRFAEKYGLHIEVVDEIDGGLANGVYTGENHIQIAAGNLEQGMLFTALHEAGHYVKANNPKGFQELSNFVLDTLDEIDGYDVNERIAELQGAYKEKGLRLSEADAVEELVCNQLPAIAADTAAVDKLLNYKPEKRKSILGVLKRLIEKIKSLWSEMSESKKLPQEYDFLTDLSEKLSRSLAEAKGKIRTGSKAKYSIVTDVDGQYVDIDTKQEIFDGVSVEEMPSVVRKYINQTFKGRVLNVGEEGKAYVNRESSGEYAFPAKRLKDSEIKEAKMRAATELDNLLSVSQYVKHEVDDGRHPDAKKGWYTYRTNFKVGDSLFTGDVKIKGTDRGYVFYDVTKIKRTARNYGQAETSTAAISSNPSNNIIPDSSSKSNNDSEYSLKGTEEDYNALIKKYGAIKRGVNPARDIKVPKQTSDDKKVRQLTRTVLETESVTPELIDEIKQGIVNEDFSYTPIPDKEAKNFADWKVNTDGMENAQKQWEQVTSGKRTATKNDIAVAEYMLLNAEANNDIKTALRLINEIAIEATRAGQVVQAMSMLKKLGGIGQLTYIKKLVDKFNLDLQKRAKKNKPAPQITINEELAQNLIRAKTQEAVQVAVDALLSDIANQIPSTWVDKWNAWRYLSMLGNPRTHIRNLTGNAVFMPAISLKNILAAGIEKAVGLSSSDMVYTKAVKVKQEYKDFALKDFEQVKEAVTGSGKMNPSDMIRDKQQIFKTQFLESVRKFNFNLLEKEDILFLQHHYARALSMYLQSNRVGLKNASENTLIKARKYAINEAQKATFRDASKMANMFSRLSHLNKGASLVVEGMLPFKKTPINILKRGVEYSPLGLIKAITYDLSMLRKGEANGGININEFIDGIACGLSGTMIMVFGAFLASLGIIQGGMGDDKEGQFEKLKGVQAYSVQIGGVSYTIDWMAPASLPLFVGVEFFNATQGDYENATFADIAESLARISEPVFEMSMLSGLNNTFDAVKFSDNTGAALLEEITTSYLGQAVPTVLGQAARTIDGTRRRTYVDKNSGIPSGAQRFIQKVMNKTPIVSFLNQPYVDQWGREDTNDNIFLRALENFVSPGFVSEIKPTELDNALTELYSSTGDTGVLPSSPQKYITNNGERIDLTASQYTILSQTRGRTAQRVLSALIATPEYARLTDDEKAAAVSYAYKYAAEVAKSELLGNEISVSWCRKAYNQETKSGGSAARYILRNKIK